MEIAIFSGIIVVCFGAMFGAFRILLQNAIVEMKDAIKKEVKNMDKSCRLISGNLHSELVSEQKQRVVADNKLEENFKNHGHRGLDNGGSKVTI